MNLSLRHAAGAVVVGPSHGWSSNMVEADLRRAKPKSLSIACLAARPADGLPATPDKLATDAVSLRFGLPKRSIAQVLGGSEGGGFVITGSLSLGRGLG